MVSLAWVTAYAVRFSGYLPIPKGIPDPALYLKLLPFIWIIWLLTFAASGFYRRTGRHRSASLSAKRMSLAKPGPRASFSDRVTQNARHSPGPSDTDVIPSVSISRSRRVS